MCLRGQVEVGRKKKMAIFKVQLKCQEHEAAHVYTELSKTETRFQVAVKKNLSMKRLFSLTEIDPGHSHSPCVLRLNLT